MEPEGILIFKVRAALRQNQSALYKANSVT